uniref:Uncharacterized protein n=1 Tax=Anguilla anguilla TaxID=7936 RepID=A0A0E9Y043_ANGAN
MIIFINFYQYHDNVLSTLVYLAGLFLSD